MFSHLHAILVPFVQWLEQCDELPDLSWGYGELPVQLLLGLAEGSSSCDGCGKAALMLLFWNAAGIRLALCLACWIVECSLCVTFSQHRHAQIIDCFSCLWELLLESARRFFLWFKLWHMRNANTLYRQNVSYVPSGSKLKMILPCWWITV